MLFRPISEKQNSLSFNNENYLLLMLCIKYPLTLFISEVRFSRSNNNINIEKEHVRRGLYMQCPFSWASQPVLPTLVVLSIQNTENMIQMYKICWILSHKQNNVFMLYLDRLSWTSLEKTMKNSCANKVQMSLLYICPILCVNQHFV
jgi:hypothetical protein